MYLTGQLKLSQSHWMTVLADTVDYRTIGRTFTLLSVKVKKKR